MAGRLGRSHADVNTLGGNDGLEVDVEAVGEHDELAIGEIGTNFFGVQLGLGLIGHEDHDDVSPLCGLSHGQHFKTGLLRLGDGL